MHEEVRELMVELFVLAQVARELPDNDGNVITLQDAALSTTYFSDRRACVVDNVANEHSLDQWSEDSDSLEEARRYQ